MTIISRNNVPFNIAVSARSSAALQITIHQIHVFSEESALTLLPSTTSSTMDVDLSDLVSLFKFAGSCAVFAPILVVYLIEPRVSLQVRSPNPFRRD